MIRAQAQDGIHYYVRADLSIETAFQLLNLVEGNNEGTQASRRGEHLQAG